MIIGIPLRCEENDRQKKFFVNQRYLNIYPNVFYIMIPPNQDNEFILSLCNGFIITGGWDLNPVLYNEKNSNSNNIYDEIDKVDFEIIKHAISTQKPLLGICRGIQSVNVCCGGTLHQDINNHLNIDHKIKKIKNSRFLELDEEFLTNSFHHQSVKEVAEGFEVIYQSEDECIEIMEHASLPIILCQHHPEISIHDSNSGKIFQAFLNLF